MYGNCHPVLQPHPVLPSHLVLQVYLSDLGVPGSSCGLRMCIAEATPADPQRRLLVPYPPAKPSHSDDDDDDDGYMGGRGPKKIEEAPPLSETISPVDLLPWVEEPAALYRHWIRVEAYSILPTAAKVGHGLNMACLQGMDVAGTADTVCSGQVQLRQMNHIRFISPGHVHLRYRQYHFTKIVMLFMHGRPFWLRFRSYSAWCTVSCTTGPTVNISFLHPYALR
jgi:hypothetical protein